MEAGRRKSHIHHDKSKNEARMSASSKYNIRIPASPAVPVQSCPEEPIAGDQVADQVADQAVVQRRFVADTAGDFD